MTLDALPANFNATLVADVATALGIATSRVELVSYRGRRRRLRIRSGRCDLFAR
jgi:hypothetical protein